MVTIQEYFTIHINSVFLFLGFINLVSGSILYSGYLQRQDFVDPMLIIVPGVMAILGGFTIVFALLGCFGMALTNKYRSIIFFTFNVITMGTEIGLGTYWCAAYKKFNEFPEILNWFLLDDRMTGEEWATLQIKSGCCGVNDVYDYVKYNRTVPTHCCQKDRRMQSYLRVFLLHLCYASQVTKPGCVQKLSDDFNGDQVIVIVQLLLSGIVKALVLGGSFFIPFEQKVLLTETHDAVSLDSSVSDTDELPVEGNREAEGEAQTQMMTQAEVHAEDHVGEVTHETPPESP